MTKHFLKSKDPFNFPKNLRKLSTQSVFGPGGAVEKQAWSDGDNKNLP